MCALMWLGRMEMVMAIIMLTRSFWSDVRLSADFQVSGRKYIRKIQGLSDRYDRK